MNINRSRLIYLPVGLIVGTTLAIALTSMADDTELDTGPRVFPYNGVLELNGQAYIGQADFLFTLSDGFEAGCIFAEEHDAVSVYGGRFSVNIGSMLGSVPDCVFDSEAIFIEIAVREADDEAPHRPLAGRQRIHPVPFALWAAEGANFKVDGDLNMTGSGMITGVHAINPNGSAVSINAIASVNTINGAGGQDLTVGGGLNVGSDATHNFSVSGNALISGGLQVNAGLQANAGLDIAGQISNSNGDVDFNSTIKVLDGHDLRLLNDDDASLASDGALTIGPITGDNITMDGNEIMARDNGGNNDLHVQRDGGDTEVGGRLNVAGDVRVEGRLMRLVYHRKPPNESDTDLHIGNSEDLLLRNTICFITRVEQFNENSDRCDLNIGGSGDNQHWEYNAREADCTVTCFQWK